MLSAFHSFAAIFGHYLILFLLVNTAKTEYSYSGNTGPAFWHTLFSNDCSRKLQSPIALDRRTAKLVRLEPLHFSNYDEKPLSATLLNNGHTVQVSLKLENKAVFGGGGLPGTFEFLQFHFHWGSNNRQGSEHIVDGNRYPLELHIVHLNQKYKSTSEAIHHQDGLAVLAVFFRVATFDNPVLEPILKNIPAIQEAGSQVTFSDEYNLHDLLPFDLTHFYRYNGSLTTPTCNVAVKWTVFTSTLNISVKQLNIFRSMISKEKKLVADNFRPIQPTNDRVVYRNEHIPVYNTPQFHFIRFPTD